MIRCPDCDAETTVLETRDTATYARRRRICKSAACGKKITTVELPLHRSRNAGGDVVLVYRKDLEALHELAGKMLGQARDLMAAEVITIEESAEPGDDTL